MYYKIMQSRKFGFDRRVEISTLPIVIIGVLFWPMILSIIFKERKQYQELFRTNRKGRKIRG